MKTLPLILVAVMVALAGQSQPMLPLRPPSGPPPGQPVPTTIAAKDPVNYLIRVEWKEPTGDPKSLELLTTEGTFEFDGLQKNSVKNNNNVLVTLKLSGTITALAALFDPAIMKCE